MKYFFILFILISIFGCTAGTSQYYNQTIQQKEELRRNNPHYYNEETGTYDTEIGTLERIDIGISSFFKNLFSPKKTEENNAE